MVIIIVTCVIVLVSFAGAAFAQDPQIANTLLGVGGGAGSVGGVTGVTSLVQSNRTSKSLDGVYAKIDELFSKVNRVTEASIAQEGNKNTLSEQIGRVQEDLGSLGVKFDRMERDIHDMSLEIARLPASADRSGHRSQQDGDYL